ncbi:MAG: MerR family transcriptional regulator [Rhizobiales bacterium PAR1]|nr:MAG: MerR family transcriptional regulator [Rhizobiales bacterium PAR1]
MKIGALAERSGLSIDTLRYYEKIGLLPRASRDRGGRRQYDETSIRWIDFLRRLKATGMPLSEMIHYAELREIGDITSAARRELLERHRLRVIAERDLLTENLAAIDGKIDTYHAMEAALAASGQPESTPNDPIAPIRAGARPRSTQDAQPRPRANHDGKI